MDTKSQNSNMLLAFLTLVGVIAVVALVGFFMLHKGPEIVQGQADVNEYRVSSKVPGRILERSHYWKRLTYKPSWNRHRRPKPLHRHKTKRLSKEHARSRSRAPMKCGRKHVPA